MPELTFQVEGAQPVPHSLVPILSFNLLIANADADESISAISLRCQTHIEVARRCYSEVDQARLAELFGDSEHWDQGLRSMLWANTHHDVPGFNGSTVVDLQVPCTYDFNLAVPKYFNALEGGEVPLRFLFSGTVFYRDESGALQATQVPWDKEATYKLPVQAWKDLMEQYYPNLAWLSLQKDVFDRLHQYKSQAGFPTVEQALESLLPAGAR